MKWVKLRTSLHTKTSFRRIPPGSRLVFYVALEVAADLETGGVLFDRRPMSVADIADACAINETLAKKALDTLVSEQFLTIREDGSYVIEKWHEKTDPEDSGAAERQRRKREKEKREASRRDKDRDKDRDVTRDCHDSIEREKEIDSPDGEVTRLVPKPCLCAETASVRILDSATPEDLADRYLEVFANCRSFSAKAKRRAAAVGMLREMQTAGNSWNAVFEACAQVHADGNHAPIWMAAPIWTALRSKPKSTPELSDAGKAGMAAIEAREIAAAARKAAVSA